MYGRANISMMRSFRQDPTVTQQKLKPGTVRRIVGYAKPYKLYLSLFLVATILDSLITVVNPLLLRVIIDKGILGHREAIVVGIAGAVAAVAAFDAFLGFIIRWYSARIGEGLIYDLRTEVFSHVQQQPIAFFTRAQTGSLVSRLNSDVLGAEQAITSTMASVVSNILTVGAILVTMFYLSWQISLVAIVLIPLFLLPARRVGRRLQRLTRESMQLDAAMGSTMTERFNVAGAMLVKLFGRPREESDVFAERAGRVRDIGVIQAMYGQVFVISLTLLAALATAVVYGLGGSLVIRGALQVGTLVALSQLLIRVYGPIAQLSNVQISVMTALVSFDRVFEILDLKPLIAERPDAIDLKARMAADGPAGSATVAPQIEFDDVSFRYPTASEVSLASLESIALPRPERPGAVTGVLHEVSFRAPSGQLTALVGPSGAGKTTITALAARLYDPNDGVVRIGGYDVKDVTLESLHDVVGVVTQDAHLFHDTIRANLSYAQPSATELELIEACEAAQIWDLISGLPDGLDTVVGDRGYRLSGGEKQRVAVARLLLKAPSVVVLDEATAHLDSESEAAVQRALKTALAGRTSLVIAHRLSTIREADQILVVDAGRIVQRGTHEELLAAGGLYADLYHTQFVGQAA
jgi:ATP-binding cassette, subfamily B, bacterial